MAKDSIDAAPDLFPDVAGPEIEHDPTMDPADPRWNPKKYFDAQPKVIIVVKRNASDVLSDPTGETKQTIPASINGYSIELVKGVPTKVPKDFATMLVECGAAYQYADIPEA